VTEVRDVTDTTKRRSVEIFNMLKVARDEADKNGQEDSKLITEAWMERGITLISFNLSCFSG